MPYKEVKLIAETAFSHEGCYEYLNELTEILIRSKVDIIKFQVLLSNEFDNDHQSRSSVDKLIFLPSQYQKLFKIVKNAGKEIMAMPVDLVALRWLLNQKNFDYLELHSVNLFRGDFYNIIKSTDFEAEVFLSISGYTMSEIKFIYDKYRNNVANLSLMYGFQSFPTSPEKLNLSRINELSNSLNCNVGYADHTSFNENDHETISLAVASGARFLEKHVVLEKGKKRTDYESAVDVWYIDKLKERLSNMQTVLGSRDLDVLNDSEIVYRNRRLRLTTGINDLVYRWFEDKPDIDPVAEFDLYFSGLRGSW